MEQFRGVIEFCIRRDLSRDILPGHLGVTEDKIDGTAYLVDDLGADDLDMSDIAADLYERYGLPDDFDGDTVARATTFDDLVQLTADAYIAARAGAEPTAVAAE